MKLKIAGIIRESIVDGPGIRSVIFAQGCPRSCPGCHNPETIDPAGGRFIDSSEIIKMIDEVKLLKGVTFSGGEPFMQADAFAGLGKLIKQRGLDIMTYTGYTWAELLKMSAKEPGVMELLTVSDYLVDGPFIELEKDLKLAFRGSRNQQIINVRESLQKKEVVPAHVT